MATLRFGVWPPTSAWADAGPERLGRLVACPRPCEQHDIDRLLAAPGPYGGARREPPVRHPVVLATETSTLCRLSGGRVARGVGPGWRAPECAATGSRVEERGRGQIDLLATRLVPAFA